MHRGVQPWVGSRLLLGGVPGAGSAEESVEFPWLVSVSPVGRRWIAWPRSWLWSPVPAAESVSLDRRYERASTHGHHLAQ